ncbi:hypothetical protein CCYA_CCYA19G4692 [Cyanidiococcus yangmingshanensis]|nr:hypothetical protein CCYA_CCYA19G4692 [Cyanidiococcus yangmingshanensis]
MMRPRTTETVALSRGSLSTFLCSCSAVFSGNLQDSKTDLFRVHSPKSCTARVRRVGPSTNTKAAARELLRTCVQPPLQDGSVVLFGNLSNKSTRRPVACLDAAANERGSNNAARPGTVYLVGAGPGAFELLTWKAICLLSSADVILYDDLAQELVDDGLWRRIGRTIWPTLTVSVGKQRYKQHEINKILVQQAKEMHRSVVRLKCGDPSLFGRIHEEVAALRDAAVPFEVIPGVSSCTAAPIAAGIFLTERERGRSVLLLSGHDVTKIPYEAAACAADTIVLLMVSRNITAVASQFLSYLSPKMPVALCHTNYGLQWGGTLAQAARGEAIRALQSGSWNRLQTTVAVIGDVARETVSIIQVSENDADSAIH